VEVPGSDECGNICFISYRRRNGVGNDIVGRIGATYMTDEEDIQRGEDVDYVLSVSGGHIIMNLLDDIIKDAKDGVWALAPDETGKVKDFMLRAQGISAEVIKDKILRIVEDGKQTQKMLSKTR